MSPTAIRPYKTDEASPLGQGFRTPLGSMTDSDLFARVRGYRRRVASGYRAMGPDDVSSRELQGPMFVSPKIDGHLWFMVFDRDDVFLASPKGRVIYGDIPLLAEARRVHDRAVGRTIVAGELWAVPKATERPRVGGVGRALSGGVDADVRRLGFAAFDLLQGGVADKHGPMEQYEDRLAALRTLLDGGKRCRVVNTEEVADAAAVRERYVQWVDSGKAEGLVVRPRDGRIYKVKPVIPVDAVVIGYTRRGDDPDLLRSVLLALRRDHDQFQVLGSCGNFGDEDMRRELLAKLMPMAVDSTFRKASSDGSLYRFVRPEMVMEIKISDIQSEDSSGGIVRRMVLELDSEGGWRAVRPMAGVSIIHPVMVRVRTDKTPSREEIRIEQVLERCEVPDIAAEVTAVEHPTSTLVRREVWTKTTKDRLAVRKLLVWRTNKDEGGEWPAWIVKWVDYSPGRKEPIQHTVRPAPDEAMATTIADALVAKNIKKGWAPVEAEAQA